MQTAKASLLKAFTLIELLIVVAIIAILAAIAVPNFLEAQTRAKVSRAKNDMRVVVTGLEAYRVDNNQIPMMNSSARCISPPTTGFQTLERLTTPISYIVGRSVFNDPFIAKGVYETTAFSTRMASGLPDPTSLKEFFYTVRNDRENIQWTTDAGTNKRVQWYLLECSGPDLMKHYMGAILNSMTTNSPADQQFISRVLYDPTNGTVSLGSIWRSGGSTVGRGSILATMISGAGK